MAITTTMSLASPGISQVRQSGVTPNAIQLQQGDRDEMSGGVTPFRPMLEVLDPDVVQPLLEEDCTFTNGGYAQCLVWDCGSDGVCVEYGEYCVDAYGEPMACP